MAASGACGLNTPTEWRCYRFCTRRTPERGKPGENQNPASFSELVAGRILKACKRGLASARHSKMTFIRPACRVAGRIFHRTRNGYRKTNQTRRHSAQEKEAKICHKQFSCPKKEDFRMHTTEPTRTYRYPGSKIVADVVRLKTMSHDDVTAQFKATIEDWSESERKSFTAAVAASHGWQWKHKVKP